MRLWAAIAIVVVGRLASAQTTPAALDARPFVLSPDFGELSATPMADVLPSFTAALSLWLDSSRGPLHVAVPELGLPPRDIVEWRTDAHLLASVGLFGPVEAGFDVPWILYQGGLDSPYARSVL